MLLGGGSIKSSIPEKIVALQSQYKEMTPFETWYGKKPRIDHIPKEESGKFDTKAKICTVLGYGEETKGYRLYDVKEKKVFYSRDVQFNEDAKDNRQDL